MHLFQIGIFWSGNDSWAINIENKWLKEKSLQYDFSNKGCKRKGWILKCILCRASDTVSECLQNISKKYLQEYILARRKKNIKMEDHSIIKKISFNGRYEAYLVKVKSKQGGDILEEYVDIIAKMIFENDINYGSVFEQILKRVDHLVKEGNSNFIEKLFLVV